MSEYVGRTGSQRVYSYPLSRRDTTVAFARNFAVGPALPTDIETEADGGTQVPWSGIESGAPPDEDVPITPRTTGIIQVSGVITVKSSSDGQESVHLLVLIDDVAQTVPLHENVSIDPNGFEAIPILVTLFPNQVIGTEINVQIQLNASTTGVLQIAAFSSTLALLEMPVATG